MDTWEYFQQGNSPAKKVAFSASVDHSINQENKAIKLRTTRKSVFLDYFRSGKANRVLLKLKMEGAKGRSLTGSKNNRIIDNVSKI